MYDFLYDKKNGYILFDENKMNFVIEGNKLLEKEKKEKIANDIIEQRKKYIKAINDYKENLIPITEEILDEYDKREKEKLNPKPKEKIPEILKKLIEDDKIASEEEKLNQNEMNAVNTAMDLYIKAKNKKQKEKINVIEILKNELLVSSEESNELKEIDEKQYIEDKNENSVVTKRYIEDPNDDIIE